MIIDMEKYRHGHCRNVSQSRGAAQEIGAQAIAAQVVGMAAASVPEIYPYPETRCAAPAASVLKPTPFSGGVSRGAPAESMTSPTIPRDAPTPSPTLLCYGQCWQPCGQAASTAPAMR